jgi:hypothetical protein
MSTPDYPLLTVPGYELYQLAHLTTVAVDALARHRRAAKAREHPARRATSAAQVQGDAADAGPARAKASPGGFPTAAAALPSPGATPPRTPARTRRDNTEARPGAPAAARPTPSFQQTPAP